MPFGQSNNDVGGRVVEFTGREYMVWGRGYVESDDMTLNKLLSGLMSREPLFC